MNFTFLLHAPFEGPAAIGSWAAQNGASIQLVHLYAGEVPAEPGTAETDVVVAMGGPMNIYQYRDHPWLKPERLFMERALQRGSKLIGICLGAQILADVLGARVCQNPEREIGWMPVNFSTAAQKKIPALPAAQAVLHWHGDTFDLPRGSLPLASSEACPNQGFIYQDQVLALQFHLEMTAPSVDLIIENCRNELVPGRFVQSETEIRNLSPVHAPDCEKVLGDLLGGFLQG